MKWVLCTLSLALSMSSTFALGQNSNEIEYKKEWAQYEREIFQLIELKKQQEYLFHSIKTKFDNKKSFTEDLAKLLKNKEQIDEILLTIGIEKEHLDSIKDNEKREIVSNIVKTYKEDGVLDESDLHSSLLKNQFRIINLTKRKVNFLVFSCNYTALSRFGFVLPGGTYCHNDMFNVYPHRVFAFYENFFPSKGYLPVLTVDLPENPIQTFSLEVFGHKRDMTFFTIKETKILTYKERDFLGKWVYVSAYSPNCKEDKKFKGEIEYTGSWTRSLQYNTQGWISPDRSDNPSTFIIRSRNDNPCDFQIEGR